MQIEELPEKINWGTKYGRAVAITDQEEAKAYFEVCVQHMMKYGKYSREEAESIERQNIGYWAGYGGAEDFNRVMKLYGTAHPIFGTSYPTPAAAFNAGRKT